jgi:double zinc ribbon protein
MNSLLELILGVLLAAGGVYFVLRPIFSPPLAGALATGGTDAATDPEDDISPQTVALRALKEIEFDRATGKLADGDYESLKGKYTAEALQALRQEGPAKPQAEGRRPASAAASRAAAARACPTHGPRPESEAEFCSECGRRLAAAPGFCPRCGTTIQPDARFCARCGGRVAA